MLHMKHLVFASLALATMTGSASARRIPMPPAPPAPSPPAPGVRSCKMAGLPLFEIRHRSEIAAPTSTVSVYATGAWVYRPVAEDGTPGAISGGCLDRRQLASIRQSLRNTTWDVTHQKIRCFAYAPSYTEYVVRGRVMFHDQLCSGDVLDEQSRAQLTRIESILPQH